MLGPASSTRSVLRSRDLATAVTLGTLLAAGGALAQETIAPPPPAEGDVPDQAPPPDAEVRADEMSAIRAELQRQQAELEEHRRTIDALRAELDARPANPPGDDAQLDALLADHDDLSEYAAPEPLRLYGYMDMGLQKSFAPSDTAFHGLFPTRAATFILGNVNLYVDAAPATDWRALTELRFTLLPHGEELDFPAFGVGEYRRVDREGQDITNPDGREHILFGSVVLERAWIQWQSPASFKVRVGQWLAPFGIWNVDHGTPVLIALVQPDFQIGQVFPTAQLGVQVLGDVGTGHWTYGYSAYVSNGRTPSQFDFTDDKAVGGRVRAQYIGDWRAAVGASAYWGTFVDIEKEITRFTPLLLDERRTVEAEEGVLGLDVAIDADALRLRAEGVYARVDYAPGKHAPASFGPPGAVEPDSHYWDGYVLVAYLLPFWGLEPYAYAEVNHHPNPFGDTALILAPGFNVHFDPAVQLKTMVSIVSFDDVSGEDTSTDNPIEFAVLTSRLVIAF